MNLHVDSAEFAPIIQAAVDRAIAKLRDNRPTDEADKILLDKRGAAHALSVSVSTVDRLRRDAALPCIKLDGEVLFRPEALREWAAARESQS